MYMNTGYLNHSHMDFKDKSRPLVVGSCGTYRLSSHPKLPTYRPRGRLDYQIIYITAGCGHFHFDNVDNETIVPAGNIVLYRPKELQKYEYYGKDKTEVYWIHFTGSNVKISYGNMDSRIKSVYFRSEPLWNTNRFSSALSSSFSVARIIMKKCLSFCSVIFLSSFIGN